MAPRHPLDPFFRPASVAVVGASATPGSVGNIVMRNLLASPFGGVVYPVNPRRPAVHGVRCYPSLHELPEAIDLAVIATPPAVVPSIVSDCVARDVRAAIIITASFSERGAEGRALEQQVRATARGKLRVVGPSCLGVIAPYSGLNASVTASMPQQGRVALLSQSGAIGAAVLDWARESHVGFSAFVSAGTMLDVDFADLLDYFGDDPNTRSIVLYLEAVGGVRRFFSAARAVARAKHVIVVKAGRHEAATRAAASHLGAMVSADAVFDAAVRRAGLLRVTTIPDLFNMAEILGSQPPPRGPALAILTNAGGPGVMAADELLTHGGQLAALGPETLAALDGVLPPYWGRANPVDLGGDADPERYRRALEVCARDPAVQGVLLLLAPQPRTDPTETARRLAELAHREAKPLLASWLGGTSVRAGKELLGQAGIATFDAPEAAVRAFLHMVQYRRSQELLYETPAALPQDWQPDQPRARGAIHRAHAAGRTLLTEPEAKELLAAYGILGVTVPPMVREKGYELIVGSSLDEQFGPVIVFGTGGVLVEVLQDRALGLPPLNRTLARRLIERTRIGQALLGARGRRPVPIEQLETLLVRFSYLLCDLPDVQEIDVNPLLATPDGLFALDARVLLLPADTPPERRSRLTIEPYPNQYTTSWTLADGTPVVVRAIRPEDEASLLAHHASLSPRTIRMRFFSMVKTLNRDRLIRLCHLDYAREMALVAERRPADGPAAILGVSRYYLNPGTCDAEFAIVVSDAMQGQGLGQHLMQRLIAVARDRGVRRLVGSILRENAPMLALAKGLGFREVGAVDTDAVEVALDLR